MTVSNFTDILIALAVVAFAMYRQFTWQLVSPSKLWRMPLILAAVGIIMLAQTKSFTLVKPVDLAILGGELLIAVALGAAMGTQAKFRTRAQRATDVRQRSGEPVQFDPSVTVTESRTGAFGVVLWVALIAIRIGVEVAVLHYFPSALLASTGTILLVLAANRAARALVVGTRMERRGLVTA